MTEPSAETDRSPGVSRRRAVGAALAGLAAGATATAGQPAAAQGATPVATPAAVDPGRAVVNSVPRVFGYEGFQFEFLNAIGGAYEKTGDVGELFATAALVTDGDYDSWCAAFEGLGERLAGIAATSQAAGDKVSAREAWLRASGAYARAYFFTLGTARPERIGEVWEASRAAFDRFAALTEPPAAAVEIPYEGTTLPGYALTVDDSGKARPWLILNNGSDGTVTDLWPLAAAALRRGWNVLVFDGPGQGAMLFRRKTFFRPDWEQVVTPVVDWLLARPDADPKRVAILGISQGGYWVPRAVAFEHRLLGAIADPGVVDVSTSWTQVFPRDQYEAFLAAPAAEQARIIAQIDAGVQEATAKDPHFRFTVAMRTLPYGTSSVGEVLRQLGAYTLHGLTGQITTPLLIADPEGEAFWPGQSAELHRLVPGSALVPFTAAEGADLHCEPKAPALRTQRFYDWLASLG